MKFDKVERRGGKRKKSGAANNPAADKLFKSPLTFKSSGTGRNLEEAEQYRRSRADRAERP